MKIVHISDTHKQFDKLKLPDGDVLVHSGDIECHSPEDYFKFERWLINQPHRNKVVIAGNHDFLFEQIPAFGGFLNRLHKVHYLLNSGINIDGINFWGSPYTPEFYDWAFMCKRGEQIKEVWDLIPKTTDVLITHGPPHDILDMTPRGEAVGCEELLKRVRIVKPKLHLFGHIHEGYGIKSERETTFSNASILDGQYNMQNDQKPNVLIL